LTRVLEKTPLAAYSLESLSNVIEAAGFERWRAGQIFEWFYKKGARSFEAMKNISAPVQKFLNSRFVPLSSGVAAAHDAGDGAVKLDIVLHDNLSIEAVIIETARRVTLCVSSQVGCPLGCAFCATGQAGFERNLEAHEIVEQALHASAIFKPGRRISHVVFMGMGEPCLNIDAVFDAIRNLNAPNAFNIGARKITISTLGYPRCIDLIAEFPMEVGLAISLHAATDELRRKLVPCVKADLKETIAAGRRYFTKTGREVTYEYVLLAGVNDSERDAAALARALSGERAFVNLIPYNEVEGLDFRRPSERKAAGFKRALESRGINVEVRDSRGRGAKAACGQLRFERQGKPAEKRVPALPGKSKRR
jgi:23S rRNA (adenine2503-C2)-methyltransferase